MRQGKVGLFSLWAARPLGILVRPERKGCSCSGDPGVDTVTTWTFSFLPCRWNSRVPDVDKNTNVCLNLLRH